MPADRGHGTDALSSVVRSIYPEEGNMDTIRILHHYASGYSWSFDSPDVPGLTGGTDAYDPAHAEEATRFALTCAAEEQGSGGAG